jgi:peroxiredoxin
MKRLIKMLPVAALLCLTFSACDNKNKFTVEGTIEGAQDSTLYFQQMTLSGPVMLDSVKLDANGRFSFQAESPEAPEFYVLRIYDQIINIAIDSTETVTVKAKQPNMAANYEVEGSDECSKIRELALMQQALQRRVIALDNDRSLSRQQALDSLQRMLNGYKQEVTEHYIFQAPYRAYAYFALFQTIGPWLIFDPKSNREDVKVFAAVATSWDTYYPKAERGVNLHNIAIEGMKNVRIVDAHNRQASETPVDETGVIELNLTDNHGKQRTLTELKGKVVLLDFHTFTMDKSPQRILMLRELYNKYHAQGLEIYQVSLDQDEHFWRQQTQALPWICVRDADGHSAVSYNVQALPEYFTIDRKNQLQKRSSQIKDLDEEVRKLLSFRAD